MPVTASLIPATAPIRPTSVTMIAAPISDGLKAQIVKLRTTTAKGMRRNARTSQNKPQQNLCHQCEFAARFADRRSLRHSLIPSL
jgi:hypothetical protein